MFKIAYPSSNNCLRILFLQILSKVEEGRYLLSGEAFYLGSTYLMTALWSIVCFQQCYQCLAEYDISVFNVTLTFSNTFCFTFTVTHVGNYHSTPQPQLPCTVLIKNSNIGKGHEGMHKDSAISHKIQWCLSFLLLNKCKLVFKNTNVQSILSVTVASCCLWIKI